MRYYTCFQFISQVGKLESILQFQHLQWMDALQKWYKQTFPTIVIETFWDTFETQKSKDYIFLSFSWFKCMQTDSSFKTMLFITVFKEESFLKWNHAEEYLMRNSKKHLRLFRLEFATSFGLYFIFPQKNRQ